MVVETSKWIKKAQQLPTPPPGYLLQVLGQLQAVVEAAWQPMNLDRKQRDPIPFLVLRRLAETSQPLRSASREQ